VEKIDASVRHDSVEGVLLLPRSLDVVVSHPAYVKVKPLGKQE
jgi:hypothetical protein